MPKKSASMKEIAYELGLSVNTVSRAFRDCYDISENTKEKVRLKAIELGYVPPSLNQFVKRDGRKLIALIYNSNSNLYYNLINQKIIEIILKEGHYVSLIWSSSKTLDEELIKQCLSERVDSIITSILPDEKAIVLAKIYDISLIYLGEYEGTYKDKINTVYVNNYKAGMIASSYLADYHKGERFIYLGDSKNHQSNKRKEGFVDGLKRYFDNPDVLSFDNRDINSQHLLALIYDGYQSIFCFNDEVAYTTIKALEESIPHISKVLPHLHIIGMDALSINIVGLKDLTSISFDYSQLAKEAMKVLNGIWSHKENINNKIVIEPSLHQKNH